VSTRTLLLLACLAAAPPARAADLWESDDGDWRWTGGGFFKTEALGMGFRGIDLYEAATGADRAGLETTKLRLGTELSWRDLAVGVQHELRFSVFTRGMDAGVTMPGFGATQAARPRLWSIPDVEGAGLLLENDLDRYTLEAALGPVDLTLGRQAISWGSAWFWKPTDRWSPFSPTDIDPDVKRGVDAARVEVSLGPRTDLDLIASFERHPDGDRELWVHGGARLRTGFGRWDLAVSVARFQLSEHGNWMVGLETTGELGKVGVRAEVAGNVYEDGETWDIEGVLGADYHFPFKLTVAGELFYNGYGTDRAEGYAAFWLDPVRGERLARGEAFNVGRYYLGLSLDQEVHPLLHLSLGSVTNLADPSGMLLPGLQWSVVQDARVRAGAMIPLGKPPRGLSLRSEYGAMPVAGYIVLKLSF